jgi:hypothetical protein
MVVPDGDTRIQCVKLDECLIGQRVDYIKLDVEGHDLAALEGARDLIDRYRPVLAIAGYHRWDDIWRIPEFLKRYAPDYRITYRTPRVKHVRQRILCCLLKARYTKPR